MYRLDNFTAPMTPYFAIIMEQKTKSTKQPTPSTKHFLGL